LKQACKALRISINGRQLGKSAHFWNADLQARAIRAAQSVAPTASPAIKRRLRVAHITNPAASARVKNGLSPGPKYLPL